MQINKLLCCLFIFCINYSVFAQETGNLLIKNYPPSVYKANVQNWALIQDSCGIMYFGNADGILQYNGTDWDLIKLSRRSLVRAFNKDKNETIYVGAVGDFGYLKTQKNGKIIYQSLKKLINKNEQHFLDVWNIFVVNSDIYFLTNNIVFCYNGKTLKSWHTKNIITASFELNNEVYVYEEYTGIKKITPDTLALIPYGDFFKKQYVGLIIPVGKSEILVSTDEEGLYIFDLNKPGNNPKEPIARKFNTQADTLLKKTMLYRGILLKNGNIAISAVPAGVVILDKNGRLIHYLNKETGFLNTNITDLYEDKESNLWFTLANGIARTDINSPVTHFNGKNGVDDVIMDFKRFKNTLYIGTFSGIAKVNNNKILKTNFYEGPVFGLLHFKNKNDSAKDKLLAATNFYGVIEAGTEPLKPVLYSNSVVYSLFQPSANPDLLYLGKSGALEVAKYQNNRFTLIGSIEGITEEITDITDDKHGNIWAISTNENIYKITPSDNLLKPAQTEIFTKETGIPDFPFFYNSDEVIYLASKNGIYSYNQSQNKFLPDTTFGKIFCEKDREILEIKKMHNNETWISSKKQDQISLTIIKKDKKTEWYNSIFNILPQGGDLSVYIEPDSSVWTITYDGLYKVKGFISKKYPDFKVKLKSAVFNYDTLIYYGNDSALHYLNSYKQKIKLKYNFNSVVFHFTALSFYAEEQNLYQTKLVGFDKDWTDWTHETKRIYTSLPAGKYKFMVRAKNIYNVTSNTEVFEFTILPPWYKTKTSFAIFIILILSVIYFSVKQYIKRLKDSNLKLENIIKERTNEIMVQNSEIQKQRDELKYKNEQINASIRYAQNIQYAILPTPNTIRKSFEHFVIYRPKDIVSGDFYWYSEITKRTRLSYPELSLRNPVYYFFAVCDCTGHGIPGAFMSMIGSRLLSEIINEKQIFETNLILEELDKQIEISLNQKEGTNEDGMDISLVRIEKTITGASVQFSGAHNNAFILHSATGEIKLLKGDTRDVGGASKLSDLQAFRKENFELLKDDFIYLATDGVMDQNNTERKKFGTAQLMNELKQLSHVPVPEQKEILITKISTWMNNCSQRDDMTLAGIKI